jgi:hypothetical protein
MSETHAETDALRVKIEQARARLQAMEVNRPGFAGGHLV